MHRHLSSNFFKKNRILRFAQKGLQCFMQNDEKRGGSVSGKKWNKSNFRRDLAINSQKYFLKLGPNLTLLYPKCYTIIIGGDVCELLS